VLDLYIAPIGGEAARHAMLLARELREAGASVELGLDAKLKRALELANKSGARYALILGDNEIAAGRYTLKDMASGEQTSLTRDALREKFGQ